MMNLRDLFKIKQKEIKNCTSKQTRLRPLTDREVSEVSGGVFAKVNVSGGGIGIYLEPN